MVFRSALWIINCLIFELPLIKRWGICLWSYVRIACPLTTLSKMMDSAYFRYESKIQGEHFSLLSLIMHIFFTHYVSQNPTLWIRRHHKKFESFLRQAAKKKKKQNIFNCKLRSIHGGKISLPYFPLTFKMALPLLYVRYVY